MIVDCPSCHTSFEVDPAVFMSGERRVRCNQCGYIWRVDKERGKIPLKPSRAGAKDVVRKKKRGFFSMILSIFVWMALLTLAIAVLAAFADIFGLATDDGIMSIILDFWRSVMQGMEHSITSLFGSHASLGR